MNRIYQGRVTKVEVLKAREPGTKGKCPEEWELLGFQKEEVKRFEKEREELRLRTTLKGSEGIAARQRLKEINETLNRPWQEALWAHHELFQDAVNY